MPKTRTPVKSRRLRVVARDGARVPERAASKGPVAIRKAHVTIRGKKVAYRTGGWGPLLVLIHGITSNSATWDRVLPELANHYTVLAPDLLGHGRSDKLRGDYSVGAHANTIRDLMDVLGYRRATFVGHSLGGGVAMQLAYQYPERVDRLVLVAPGGFGREVSLLLRAASVPGSGRVLALAAARPLVQAGTLLTAALGRLGLRVNTDLEEVGRAYALLADPAARKAFVSTLRSVVDHEGQRVDLREGAEVAGRFRSLIVWGERDRIVPARHGKAVHELVPHTYLSVFKGAGHFPHRDDPERFVQVVDEFLAREWRLRKRQPERSAALVKARRSKSA
jgi:pimeloyl-ACP methyl ester carboxylesterase